MNDYGRWLAGAIDRTSVRVFAWLLVAAVMAGQWYHARHMGFADDARPDGHAGHAQIDFGGQWLFGRMLALGRTEDLYRRSAYFQVAYDAYPRSDETPGNPSRDAETLVGCFVGTDPPGRLIGVQAALTAFASPLYVPAAIDFIDEEYLESLRHPPDGLDVGGPLYPPVHAFLMAPLALGDHPREAYFAWQWAMMGMALLAGAGASYLSRGRLWWSAAVLLTLGFPGYRPSVDLGQNSALTLAVVVWGWALAARGRPVLGGVVWGLLAYKPVWGLSFFAAALALRQWRLCLTMAVTGLTLVAGTLPVVGVQAWKDWLRVGSEAAALYDVDVNWVYLSRDLFGVPRRILIDFNAYRDDRETVAAQVAAWAAWLFVFECTARAWALRRRREPSLTGPFPAFAFLAAWACCYHFMYYDSLMALAGVFVLLAAGPSRYFTPVGARLPGKGGVALGNSVALTLVVLLVVNESILSGLDVQATVEARYFKYDVVGPDGGTASHVPTAKLATNARYPWDTLLVLLLWAWCGALAFRDEDTG